MPPELGFDNNKFALFQVEGCVFKFAHHHAASKPAEVAAFLTAGAFGLCLCEFFEFVACFDFGEKLCCFLLAANENMACSDFFDHFV